MKKNIIVFFIFLLLAAFSWTQEISPDTYVLINTHRYISGESDDGFMYIDFPTYMINTGNGVLQSLMEIDVTDATKVIIGKGLSLGGNVGGGASTSLSLYDTLVEDGLFEIQPDGSAMIYYADQWISLLPGETWTDTIQTNEYEIFSGDLIVEFTVTNYGIWDKSLIDQPGTTPSPEPASTCGDVNNDGDVGIVDALLVAQYYIGLNVILDLMYADVNSDGEIDIIDALLIAQYFVGLSVTLVCP